MGKFDFITPFYNSPHDYDSLIEGLDEIMATGSFYVRAVPFSSDTPPSDYFPKASNNLRRVSLIRKNKGNQLFELTCKIRVNGDEKHESGRFFIYEHQDYKKVYVALTIEPTEFFTRALLPLIKSFYPRLSLTFITHKRLRRLLDNFQIVNQFTEIIITRAAYRLRFEEEGKHKKIVPATFWPGMELKVAFDWIYQNNGWFQSLQCEARRHSSTIAEISLTRQGIVRTNRLFSKVFEAFVLPVCKTIHENIEIFGHRGRLERQDLSVKPLTIEFGMDQFADISENTKFIQAMKRYKTASVSVLHGNPYLHMAVIDYFDGSTFDLWVLDKNQLIIVPQLKGSIYAIKRLVNHVFDAYAEGSIGDYEGVVQ